MSLRYPFTARNLATLAGSAIGGISGGLLGSKFRKYPDTGTTDNYWAEGITGGAVAGGALGLLLQTLYRRRAERGSKERALDAVEDGEDFSSVIPQGSRLAGLVSGVHQQGRADTAEAIGMGRRRFGGTWQHPMMALTQLAGFQPGYMAGSAFNTIEARERLRDAKPRAIRSI